MPEREGQRRELLVSKGWVQTAALVFLMGFFILAPFRRWSKFKTMSTL